ncbi:hypothetical protein BS47DRAFT_1338942 [Hydnum rufescens UP504]|uniref:3,4-dihydroxy-2-butanone-4-phosphate synthase n=1 Tax=Hydnum rufescens UP504 TaxID=1448309 RepID=A0A9P6DWS2_9AGAM|nr:hypothetical protein BS47DRAFT_1338942 [Hydnum rufescens UP504]
MSPALISAFANYNNSHSTLNASAMLKQEQHLVVDTASSNGHTFPVPEPTTGTTTTGTTGAVIEKSTSTFKFDDMDEALAAFRAGEFLLVMDDEGRENEGDLIIAASCITPEKMAWFIKVTSGFVCIALPGDRLEELQLPMMVANNTEHYRTAYTITVDYAHAPAPASEFTRPGHLVPLRARDGGVLTRRGHTESAVDLCLLTQLPPAGLLCELVNDDAQGTMARRDDCRVFSQKHGIKMISVEMIVEARRRLLEAAEQGGKEQS